MGDTKITDGRVERACRTGDAITDALLSLINEGNLRPTAAEIADRANVALRTVYVHFDDLEALFHAAAVRHATHMEQLCWPLLPEGTFEERLKAFLDRKAIQYEAGWNVLHASLLQEPFSSPLSTIMEAGRQAARDELGTVFREELTGAESKRKHAQLDITTNATAWQTLRAHHKLRTSTAKSAMAIMVRQILGVP